MNFAIGLPAFNEEKNIASIILKLKPITKTIIVCDDGSSDLTGQIANELGVITIIHEKNLGYGAAVASLFKKAKELGVDALVTFDADGQHVMEDIKNVLEPIIENKADIVIGSRFLEKENDVPKYRKLGIKTITGVTNILTGNKITDSQSGFRAYDKKVLQDIVLTDSGMGVSTEILIKSMKNKFRITEVPIKILYGENTSTHNPVSHGSKVLLSTVKYVAIQRPLTFYGIPGLVFLSLGLFFVAWTLQAYTESHSIITNISLIGIGGTILGVLLLITATILHSIVTIVREKN